MKYASMVLVAFGVALFLIGAFLSGCATTGSNRGPSMGCLDVLDKDCDDPTAYPPLTAQLPPWPFPRLIQPLPEEKQ